MYFKRYVLWDIFGQYTKFVLHALLMSLKKHLIGFVGVAAFCHILVCWLLAVKWIDRILWDWLVILVLSSFTKTDFDYKNRIWFQRTKCLYRLEEGLLCLEIYNTKIWFLVCAFCKWYWWSLVHARREQHRLALSIWRIVLIFKLLLFWIRIFYFAFSQDIWQIYSNSLLVFSILGYVGDLGITWEASLRIHIAVVGLAY